MRNNNKNKNTLSQKITPPPLTSGLDWKLLGQIALISATEGLALASLRQYATTKEDRYLVGGVLGYAAVAVQLPEPLSHAKLGPVNVLWNGISSLTGVFVGNLVFKEKLEPLDYIGIPLSVVGGLVLATNHNS
jgi:multidrug transporter EmrE-like cation transporter